MNVSLGSIEVDDRTCRLIRKSTFGISGRATRKEVKAWALSVLAEELNLLDEIDAPEAAPSDDEEEEVAPVHTVIDLTEYIASNA